MRKARGRYCFEGSGGGKLEREHRTAAYLTGHADRAVVGFDDGFGDGKSHARTLHAVTLVAAAVELVEDERLFEVVDAGAVIGNAGYDAISTLFGGNGDGRGGRRILGGV